MKNKYLLLYFCLIGLTSKGQQNCSIYTDSVCNLACRLSNLAGTFPQGSRSSQEYFDSAIRLCPDMADAWREISVPYLKRGDFATWRKYIDKAVALQPGRVLDIRGWCRFKFLRDYEGALEDLRRFDSLSHFLSKHTGDGTYSLNVVMALCERELGNYSNASLYFSKGIDSIFYTKGKDFIGLFDFLHRAVLKLRQQDYTGALSDLDQQEKLCRNYVETSYYKGMAYRSLGKHKLAKQQFKNAARLYKEGFHLSDVYCEMLDAVYPSDVDEALAKIQIKYK
jgi:tetratricopeptide (TPR) repeat protein